MRRFWRQQSGFSLLEAMMAMVVLTITFGIVSETMMKQADVFAFTSSRKDSVSNAKFTLSRMKDEFMHLGTGDITSIGPSEIDFTDQDGLSASYSTTTDANGVVTLNRAGEEIASSLDSFSLSFFDDAGNPIDALPANAGLVRRIGITIVAKPLGQPDGISFDTVVVPREFLGYVNYQ